MPDPQTIGRDESQRGARPRTAVVLGLVTMIAAASFCPADGARLGDPSPGPNWGPLESALADLDPASLQARQLVPELIVAARHVETPDVLRQWAVLMLGRIGEPAADSVPVFLELLTEYRAAESSSESSEAPRSGTSRQLSAEAAAARRVWLLKSLGTFGDVARPAVPVLRRDLLDRSRPVDDRVLIADVLGQIGTVDAVTALADALREWPAGTSPDEQLVKHTIVDCIGLSGPAGVVGFPALLRAIEDEDSSTRRKVCEAITLFGPAGELAIDAMVERMVLDDVPAVRDAAADTLAAIGPSSVSVLIDLVDSGDPELQWRAARSLGKIGSSADAAVPALANVIVVGSTDSPEPLVRRTRIEAFSAYWQITRNASGIFSLLVDELASEDRQVRRLAAELLIEPPLLPEELQLRLDELSGGDSTAARTAAYVLRRRSAREPR